MIGLSGIHIQIYKVNTYDLHSPPTTNQPGPSFAGSLRSKPGLCSVQTFTTRSDHLRTSMVELGQATSLGSDRNV